MLDSLSASATLDFPPTRAAWRCVAILTVLYWFGMLDRQIAALLLPMIKSDLHLSDKEVSLILGPAFGLAYLVMSLPIGWLVDKISRRLVLFCGVLVWSCGAIGSGLSQSFGQIMTGRAVTGGGEASINASAYTLLSDFFPPAKLTLPLSIFNLGGNIGSGGSFMLGGAVVGLVSAGIGIDLPIFRDLHGWQQALIIAGIPGLFLAFLMWTIPEPPRHAHASGTQSSFADLGTQYRRHPMFYITLNLGFAMIMAFAVGLQSWNSAYLVRHFGWKLPQIGFYLGLGQIVSALVGQAFHGWMVDRLFAKGRLDAHLVYFAAMCVLALPLSVAAYLVPSAVGMIILYNLAYFLLMAFSGIGPAALQIATPSRLRGKASAVYMIVMSVLGTMMAPTVVATFTDDLFKNEALLGHSMALFAGITTFLATVFCCIARGPMRRAVADQNARAGL